MQSTQSRLIIWALRNRHLFKLKLKPEIVDENFSVTEFRNEIDKASGRMKVPKDVIVENIDIDGMNAEWIIPPRAANNKVLLYIHGGGFISGSCLTHRMHVAKFAKGTGLKSLLFDYRLAPEHPFPAAIEDCVKAYSFLLDAGYTPENIAIGGESAGATLTLSLLLALKEKNISLPRCAFSISPVTDLRCQSESFTYNAKKDVAPMGSWDLWTGYYVAGHDPLDPILSPQFGDFRGMPPIFMCVGSHEIHLSDCENMAKKMINQKVDVTFTKWPRMIHAFPILSPLFPEAKEAMRDICNFVTRRLEGK